MRPLHLSRRALLAGGVAALTACSSSAPTSAPTPQATDTPESRLLKDLIAEKERTIALYSSLIAGGAEKLVPFRDRHQAHVNELRKHVVVTASPLPASGTPQPTASATPKRVSLSRLRDLEAKAAELRTRQLADVSPGVAQLIASIGACEAAHVVALPRSL
ncbi:hypothetical protein [Nonomuraea jiangxiensis]|uniref:Ferritin-like domain-containing protein n=1 Tax=Nonomuraea jiangxiensis TaxID=633440 RepID=A0A1G9NRP9_9ACTN|nr:hypothetical protein [Nonomuraea jiangxiensis]SDL89060.1 hypothetical protein SAMN05421869_13281 [Nonomuraea jiangxiensis]